MVKIKKILRFIAFSNTKQKTIVLNLTYLLSIAYFQINFLPLRYYFRKYSFSNTDIEIDLQPFEEELSILNKLQRYSPVRIICLMCTFATHMFLKKKGINAPIMLGLYIEGEMSAHAWIGKGDIAKNFKQLVYD